VNIDAMNFCPQCAAPLQTKIIDGLDRMACTSSTCDFVVWDNPVPVVAALVRYQDQFILARNAQWSSEMFSLVTGYLERDELPQQAVVREVMEELGLQAEVKDFIGHYLFQPKNQLIVAFRVETRGDVHIGDEIAEVRMLTRDELAAYDFGSFTLTASIVRDWLDATFE
jgi:NADH pyrophosphatase NudC (nudix superfamily)